MIPRRNIVFAINAGLQFTPQFLPDAPLDSAYSQTLRAFGGRPLYRLFLLSGSLPTGLSLTDNGDGTATIDGTATDGGSFDFRLLLIDGERNEVTANYSINVQAAPLSLSGSIDATEVGEAFTGGVTASGGVPPYTYSLTGSVPPGLSINSSTGAAQGTATTDGIYSFNALVTDDQGSTASIPQSVEVDQPAPVQTVLSASNKASDVILSDGDTQCESNNASGFGGIVLSVVPKSSGKYFFEFEVTGVNADNVMGIGIHKGTSSLSSYLGQNLNGWSLFDKSLANGTWTIHNATTTNSGFSGGFNVGVFARCCVDIDAGRIWFALSNISSGAWIGGGNPATGSTPTYVFTPSGDYYLAACPRKGSSTDPAQRNRLKLVAPADWSITPPTGFGMWA